MSSKEIRDADRIKKKFVWDLIESRTFQCLLWNGPIETFGKRKKVTNRSRFEFFLNSMRNCFCDRSKLVDTKIGEKIAVKVRLERDSMIVSFVNTNRSTEEHLETVVPYAVVGSDSLTELLEAISETRLFVYAKKRHYDAILLHGIQFALLLLNRSSEVRALQVFLCDAISAKAEEGERCVWLLNLIDVSSQYLG